MRKHITMFIVHTEQQYHVVVILKVYTSAFVCIISYILHFLLYPPQASTKLTKLKVD